MKIKQKVLNIVNSNDYIPLTFDELSSRLNIEKKDKKIFHKIINELQTDKKILLDKNSNIIPITEQKAYPGTIQGSGSDFCYFIPDDESIDDIFIAKKDLNGAIHKDKVLVTITVEKKPNRSPEGKVLQILSRETKKLVGTFDEAKGYGFVILDDKKYGFDVFVQSGNKNGAKNNDKVVVKLIKTPSKKHKNPEGVIVEVLGGKDDPGIDIYSIAKTFKLPYEFPKKVKEQAKEIEQQVDESEKKSRMDFRDLFTVTIDGSDAKDFDDAISISKKGDNFILYVHIADVSHYVRKNTALDKEAFRRGTSVYMLDRVIPMLPIELSNGICSLNPNEDRLCLTVKMEISPTGKTLDYKFYESVINSDYRLVYKNVSDFLEDIENPYDDEKLLTALLRNYGGLFTDYVYIDEGLLAQQTELTREQVYLLLRGMTQRRIVHFIPQRKMPFITYTRNREEIDRLIIPAEVYEQRKEEYTKRVRSVINYAKNDEVCRSKQLLRYFGETEVQDCMRCDVCLEHYTDQTSEEKIKPAQDQIKHFLNDGEKHHLTELNRLSIARRQLDEALEMLIAEEEVTIEGSYIFLHP